MSDDKMEETKENNKLPPAKGKDKKMASLLEKVFSLVLLLVLILFLFGRCGEVLNLFWGASGGPVVSVVVIAVFLFIFLVKASLTAKVIMVSASIANLKLHFDQIALIPARQYLDKDLTGKLAIITGANNGIGYELSKLLASQGAEVIMACRSIKKCEEARKVAIEIVKEGGAEGKVEAGGPQKESPLEEKLTCMKLDLSDLDSVRSFAKKLQEDVLFKNAREEPRLIDYLVNNAGLTAPVGEKTRQGFESNFGIMHLGHFLLTHLLLPNIVVAAPSNRKDKKEDSSEEGGSPDSDSPAKGKPSLKDEGARIINHASMAALGGIFHESFFEEDGEGDLRGEVTDGCIRSMADLYEKMKCLKTGDYQDLYFQAAGCKHLQHLGICPIIGSYSRAKLAQVLYTKELQHRINSLSSPTKDKSGNRKLSLFDEAYSRLEQLMDKHQSMKILPPTRRKVTVTTLHPGSVQSGLVPVSDNLVRPTFGGALVLMYCLFGDVTGGSYIDELLGQHDVASSKSTIGVGGSGSQSDSYIGSQLSGSVVPKSGSMLDSLVKTVGLVPLSLATHNIQFNLNQMGKSPEHVRERLWSLSERLVGIITDN